MMHEAVDRERELEKEIERRIHDIEALRHEVETLALRGREDEAQELADSNTKKKRMPGGIMGLLRRNTPAKPPPVDPSLTPDKPATGSAEEKTS